MRLRSWALGALALYGCADRVASERLASDAVIDAAAAAPLDELAKAGRWNEPFAPFQVIGNIYYVGSATVSSFLIATPAGHFLLDGVLAQTVPQIVRNIEAVGFDPRDVKVLLNSHAHIDHAGGLAGLQRASGARMVASAADRAALERGEIGYGPSAGMRFPPIRVDQVIADGEAIALGGVTLTAHLTPGHTAGCTSWSMDVTDAAGAPHRAFFHGSSTVAGQSLVPESYLGMVAAYRASFARVRALRADVFLANHEGFFDLHGKRARQLAGDDDAFVDPVALHDFNAEMERAFESELAQQSQEARAAPPPAGDR
jgi:metallo-beta-lactamase class B